MEFTYDRNGNLLSKGDEFINTWNYDNRLVSDVAGDITNTYTYDAGGQRLTSSDGNTTTIYASKYYNTDDGNATKHIFAGGIEIAVVSGTGTGAVVRYTATDHLTGSSLTTNSSDAKEELLDYLPFGTIRIDQKAGDYSDQRKFAGMEYDGDTGLSYANARYYDSSTGRFISQDPAFLAVGDNQIFEERYGRTLEMHLMDPQSLNSYSYVNNNPLRYTDPDGEILPFIAVAFLMGGSFNLMSSMAINSAFGRNMTFGEKVGAFVSGGIAGGVVAVAPIAGISATSVTSAIVIGGTSNGIGNVAKQVTDISAGVQQGSLNSQEVAVSTAVGAVSAGVIETTLPVTKVPGISAGRGNMNAVGKATQTKLSNGTISNVSKTTAIKAAIGSQTANIYKTTASSFVDYMSVKIAPSPFVSSLSLNKNNVCRF